jgi:hypothetical protein
LTGKKLKVKLKVESLNAITDNSSLQNGVYEVGFFYGWKAKSTAFSAG